MNGLSVLRQRASVLVISMLWVNVALIAARAIWSTEASLVVLIGGALLLAGAATAAWMTDRTGPATRIATGAAQAGLVALLVYGFTGSPLQIDIHMYFFAALAITAAWIDWSRLRGSRRFITWRFTSCCPPRSFPARPPYHAWRCMRSSSWLRLASCCR